MKDKDYIEALEAYLIAVAGSYLKCKEEYYNRHLKTIASDNPERRELSEAERSELVRFPLIQGLENIQALERLTKIKKQPDIQLPLLVKELKERN